MTHKAPISPLKAQILLPFPAFLALILILPHLAFGEQKTFPTQQIKSIMIKASHVNVKIRHSSSPLYKVKWTGSLAVQLKKEVLSLQSPDFNSKKPWKTLVKQPLTLEITGPSRPLQLFSFSSQSSFSRWTQPVFISSFKGDITANKSKGPWEISIKEGSVNIRKNKGPLTIQGFLVHLSLKSSEGDFHFNINEGSLKIKDSKGAVNFTTDKADVRLIRFKGDLKGSSQSGAIRASIQPDTVDLFSEQSTVNIYFIKHAPKIKAYTSAGKIYGSRYFHKKFSGKSTTVSGRVKGSIKKGSVLLKTGTGNIYIN